MVDRKIAVTSLKSASIRQRPWNRSRLDPETLRGAHRRKKYAVAYSAVR